MTPTMADEQTAVADGTAVREDGLRPYSGEDLLVAPT
jgi:hypothetical protein